MAFDSGEQVETARVVGAEASIATVVGDRPTRRCPHEHILVNDEGELVGHELLALKSLDVLVKDINVFVEESRQTTGNASLVIDR